MADSDSLPKNDGTSTLNASAPNLGVIAGVPGQNIQVNVPGQDAHAAGTAKGTDCTGAVCGPAEQFSTRQVTQAWLVHCFTTSGIVWASLAMLALAEGRLLDMWGWLAISLIVDGLDGTLARKYRVKQVIPWFDGSALDLIVDYITWTFIPVLYMYRHLAFGPRGIADGVISAILMVVVCTSAMFCYCNKGMKSKDNYFVGFPAAWNIVALYLWILRMPWWFNLTVTVVFVLLTVLPLKFCHPFRVRKFMEINILATVFWLIAITWLTVAFPARNPVVWCIWWISGVWFIGVGVIRTLRGRAD